MRPIKITAQLYPPRGQPITSQTVYRIAPGRPPAMQIVCIAGGLRRSRRKSMGKWEVAHDAVLANSFHVRVKEPIAKSDIGIGISWGLPRIPSVISREQDTWPIG
jgi:hypothetical protein